MRLQRYFLFMAFCLLTCKEVLAQSGIKGTIKTQKGAPLPFAAIMVKGTDVGTISNEVGAYQLDLKPGYYEIVFQFLGFKTGMKSVTIENKMETFDLTMEEQALLLGEAKISNKDEDPAYTIMRRAIAKSRYHYLQVDGYTAKVYSKSSFVVTDLPMEFLYKKQLKEAELEANFKKGVPILNESVSEVVFKQPNSYTQKVLAARNSQDKNLATANAYVLTSFYQPEVVKAVSPLSPKAFAYYKFEYLGSFRENGIEVNKIKVIPRSFGEGVYKGTIHIIEGAWSIYSLDLQTVQTGFNLSVKQVYSPVQGIWMPINQQFHINGGIYGFKGKGDLIISQTFSKLKINPAFQADIQVLDGKKESVSGLKLSNQDMKAEKLEELVAKQKSFSAKNLKKLMKEYEKQDLKVKEEKGEDVDMNFSRDTKTEIDSMAHLRSTVFWDSIRSVPLTNAEITSYHRLDSIVVIKEGTQEQKDSLKTSNKTAKKNPSGGVVGGILFGHTFGFGKQNPWRLQYISPLLDPQVNTVEGLVLNGGGFALKYQQKSKPKSDSTLLPDKRSHFFNQGNWTFKGLTRYAFARDKLFATGGIDHKWKRNYFEISGGTGIAQFNAENPIHPLLNSITTLFFEQNFMKIYQKNFIRADFSHIAKSDHFEVKTFVEYADRTALQNQQNLNGFNWIDWKKRTYTSNIPQGDMSLLQEMPPHQALVLGLSAAYKPWQKYKIKKGVKTYYNDDSPQLSVQYRKGIDAAFGSDVNYDFIQLGIAHGFKTGVRNKLRYKIAAGTFMNDKAIPFPDYQHFNGNQFFFQFGDPVATFRMLDFYRFSTSKQFAEVHVLSEFRQLLLTQITWLRILGVKENVFVHYLATPDSKNYTELGYGVDVGIRFPFRIEVVGNFMHGKYQDTVLRIGTTMNINLKRMQ
jgi:hypothetical protein